MLNFEIDTPLEILSRKVYKNIIKLEISIIDLYHGFGDNNDPLVFENLFRQLREQGFELRGLYRKLGYYHTIDDLILHVEKDLTKKPPAK